MPYYMLSGVTAIVCAGFLVALALGMAMGLSASLPLIGAAVTLPLLATCWLWHRLRLEGRHWMDATVYVLVVAVTQYALDVNVVGLFYVVPVVGVVYRDWRPSVYATVLSIGCVAVFGLPGPKQVLAPLQMWAHLVLQVGLMGMYVSLSILARQAHRSLTRARLTDQMARQWAISIEARDRYTGGHVERVTAYAMVLWPKVPDRGLDLQTFHLACILHDIGKIAVPDQVLNKPGRLTPDEMQVMQSHVTVGSEMLLGTGAPAEATAIVRSHHERWDGRGYPDGLAGHAIPLAARVLALADAFDAMTSHRPYRPAMTPEEARAEILRCAGTHFDPHLTEAFHDVYPQWAHMWNENAGRP